MGRRESSGAKTWKLSLAAATAMLAAAPALAGPRWLDAASPLARNLRPRLIFVPEDHDGFGLKVSQMRRRLATQQARQFQEFINVADRNFSRNPFKAPLGQRPSGRGGVDGEREPATAGAMNYAFLYLIDPGKMRGFRFAHSRHEYGAKAIELAVGIAKRVQTPIRTWDGKMAPGGGIAGSDTWLDSHDYKNGYVNCAMALVYDWVHPMLSAEQKKAIADGVLTSYDVLSAYLEDRERKARGSLLDAPVAGVLNNGLGALALYGDLDARSGGQYARRFEEILDKLVGDLWIQKLYGWANFIWDDTSGYHGGFNYDSGTIMGMAHATYLISTALGVNFYEKCGYLRDHVFYVLYNIEPRPYDGRYYVTRFDSDPPPETPYNGVWSLEYYYLDIGPLAETHPNNARAAKWMLGPDSPIQAPRWDDSPGQMFQYGLWYHFLYEDPSVKPASPAELKLPLSRLLGEGQVVMRTGFTDPSDTLITFAAPTYYHAYSHNHLGDVASFMIDKHGHLASRRSIAKAFRHGTQAETSNNWFHNTIGVYKPHETDVGRWNRKYNLASYRDNFDSSAGWQGDPAYQPGGANHYGDRIAIDLEGENYDYVNYDYSRAWYNSKTTSRRERFKVDFARRQLLYLRPQGGADDEYVVILDRVRATDPAYTKFFLLQANEEPAVLDNAGRAVAMAAAGYPNDADGKPGGRWVCASSSPEGNNTIAITSTLKGSHGRLFNRTLLPEKFQINKTGGPGHLFEDAEGRLIWTGDLDQTEQHVRGAYTMQVQSNTGNQMDVFLNVMQIGDARTLNRMNPTRRIVADTMVGVLIEDPRTPRVAMFSKSVEGDLQRAVRYRADYRGKALHVVTDLAPGRYQVAVDGRPVPGEHTVPAETQTLAFAADGGEVRITGGR